MMHNAGLFLALLTSLTEPATLIPKQESAAPPCLGLPSILDTATRSTCLEASSAPALGKIYPLSPNLFVSPAGLVGIGTTNPWSRLHVNGHFRAESGAIFGTQIGTNGDIFSVEVPDSNLTTLRFDANALRFWSPVGGQVFTIFEDGNILLPGHTTFGYGSLLTRDGYIELGKELPTRAAALIDFHFYDAAIPADFNMRLINNADRRLEFIDSGNNANLVINQGNVGIGEPWPTDRLTVNGVTRTKRLVITGGADLAEPFQSSEAGIEPGMLVVLDPDNPGKVRLSREEYDSKISGIVSGAGGVNAGVVLAQEGKFEGDLPIALAGRAYCYADASFGPIRAGDLLTSSTTPGHARKVGDRSKAVGAIVGKALANLSEGKGLLLVVVSLQ